MRGGKTTRVGDMFGMKGIAYQAAKLDDAFSVVSAGPHFLQNRAA